MNTISKNINSLYVAKDDNYADELLKLCPEHIKAGRTVLLLSCRQFNLQIKELDVPKEQLHRLIIINFPTIDGVINKLLELHDWRLTPTFIIYDLWSFLKDSPLPCDEEHYLQRPLVQILSLGIASFLSYLNAVECRMQRISSLQKFSSEAAVCSIIALRERVDYNLKTLAYLYFYHDNVFDELVELRNHISSAERSEEYKSDVNPCAGVT